MTEYSSHKARFGVASGLFAAGLGDYEVMCYPEHSDPRTSRMYDRRERTVAVDNDILQSVMGRVTRR